jgi:hypothetical protein
MWLWVWGLWHGFEGFAALQGGLEAEKKAFEWFGV